MKNGPRLAEFQPTDGKTVKFSDVHGVDEAKDVCTIRSNDLNETILICHHCTGAPRRRPIPERPDRICDSRRKTTQRHITDWVCLLLKAK